MILVHVGERNEASQTRTTFAEFLDRETEDPRHRRLMFLQRDATQFADLRPFQTERFFRPRVKRNGRASGEHDRTDKLAVLPHAEFDRLSRGHRAGIVPVFNRVFRRFEIAKINQQFRVGIHVHISGM